MSDKTIIIVNGRNFRHNLRDFKFQSDPPHPRHNEYRLDEKHFRWNSFFLDVLEKFNHSTGRDHDLVRVYWYYANSVTPWRTSRYRADQIVERYSEQFPELDSDLVITKAKEWYDHEYRRFNQLRRSVFDDIQKNSELIDFKFVGNYVLAPFTPYRLEYSNEGDLIYQGTQIGEEGVDLGMTIDIVSQSQNYDTIILIGSNTDFSPVIDYVRNNIKRVYHFAIGRGVGANAQYFAPSMKNIVDEYQSFDELELLDKYLDESSSIPYAILEVIYDRIEQLKNESKNIEVDKNTNVDLNELAQADGIENTEDDYF